MRTTTITIAAFCLLAGMVWGVQESVPFIHADDVQASGITGLGVTVAVIDTGIFYDHPGLVGSIAPGGDSIIGRTFIGDDGEDIWGNGHGTHVSLIITDQTGVAHDARILPIRVFTWYETPNGWVFGADRLDIADAINYAISRRTLDPSIQVINWTFANLG